MFVPLLRSLLSRGVLNRRWSRIIHTRFWNLEESCICTRLFKIIVRAHFVCRILDTKEREIVNGRDFLKTGRLGRGGLVFTANIQRCAGMSKLWRTHLKNCSSLRVSCIFLRNWKYYVQNNLEKRT